MLRAVFRVVVTAGLVVLALGGVAFAQPLDLRTARVVDLTHPFDEKTLYWPNAPSGFELKRLHFGPSDGGYFYAANSFCAPEHGGTHLDAPIHFAEGQATVGQIPVEKLIGPAVVIDVARQAAGDPDYRLRLEDVQAWERRLGTIPAGALVLLRTGWSARWPDKKRYLGDDTPGDASHLRFPGFSPEAAAYLANERHVAGLGIDTASIDRGVSKDFKAHQIAGAANVYNLENLAAVDRRCR